VPEARVGRGDLDDVGVPAARGDQQEVDEAHGRSVQVAGGF